MRTLTSLHVGALSLAIGGLLAGPILSDAQAEPRGKADLVMSGGGGSTISIGTELQQDAAAIASDHAQLAQDLDAHNQLKYRADSHRLYIDTERQEYDRGATDDED